MTARVIKLPQPAPRHRPVVPQQRGYAVLYRINDVNWCPGCNGRHWWIGRHSAECVHCGCALPFGGE